MQNMVRRLTRLTPHGNHHMGQRTSLYDSVTDTRNTIMRVK